METPGPPRPRQVTSHEQRQACAQSVSLSVPQGRLCRRVAKAGAALSFWADRAGGRCLRSSWGRMLRGAQLA